MENHSQNSTRNIREWDKKEVQRAGVVHKERCVASSKRGQLVVTSPHQSPHSFFLSPFPPPSSSSNYLGCLQASFNGDGADL